MVKLLTLRETLLEKLMEPTVARETLPAVLPPRAPENCMLPGVTTDTESPLAAPVNEEKYTELPLASLAPMFRGTSICESPPVLTVTASGLALVPWVVVYPPGRILIEVVAVTLRAEGMVVAAPASPYFMDEPPPIKAPDTMLEGFCAETEGWEDNSMMLPGLLLEPAVALVLMLPTLMAVEAGLPLDRKTLPPRALVLPAPAVAWAARLPAEIVPVATILSGPAKPLVPLAEVTMLPAPEPIEMLPPPALLEESTSSTKPPLVPELSILEMLILAVVEDVPVQTKTFPPRLDDALVIT